MKKLILAFGLIFIIFGKILSQTPETPIITNVSVDKVTQKVMISWSMSNPAIVDGYIVLRQIFGKVGVVDGTFNMVATINDPNQFNYLDTGVDPILGESNPDAGIENYRVASFRIVGVDTEYSIMSEPVSTFYLYPIDFDLCLEQNTLSWSSFHGFGANLSGYRIYYSNTPLGVPILLTQQAATDTTYVHQQLSSNTLYNYFIEAYSNNSTNISSSNIQEITTTMPAVPLIMEANYGTVELFNQVDLSFTVDGNAVINSYQLQKYDLKVGVYNTIATFPSGTAEINYSDFVNTNQEIAYYKVLAINTCGLNSRESNIAHNIVLEATPNPQVEHSNLLSWNFYEGWPANVSSYTVYRSVDNQTYEEIATLDPLINSYTDDVSQWVVPEINGQASKGHFCYYVVALQAGGKQNESKSNISCAHQETLSFIPNAFNPNSQTEQNRTFKPVISFVNDYILMIYDRWGEIVFQSNDPLKGWDGKNRSGVLLKKGTYVYFLKYRSKDNQLIEKSGQINLMY